MGRFTRIPSGSHRIGEKNGHLLGVRWDCSDFIIEKAAWFLGWGRLVIISSRADRIRQNLFREKILENSVPTDRLSKGMLLASWQTPLSPGVIILVCTRQHGNIVLLWIRSSTSFFCSGTLSVKHVFFYFIFLINHTVIQSVCSWVPSSD